MSDIPDFTHYGWDKDELKRRLPLTFACAVLGVKLNKHGYAHCPFHSPDHDPSFHLYEFADEPGVMGWHCYPCDRGGDVYSLIQGLEGCSFPEALVRASEILSELPEEYVREIELALPSHSEGPATWGAEVDQAREFGSHQFETYGEWLGVPKNYCYMFGQFVNRYLGWGIQGQTILMPHWDENVVLTGCKVRHRNGDRWSKPGSKYDDLYGSWTKPSPGKDVLITEGETDKAWAQFCAYMEKREVHVYALPAGVQRGILNNHLSFLGGSKRTIYLALDPDPAGVDGTRAALQAFKTASFPDVRVCGLPRGRDLRDANPKIEALLRDARLPYEVKRPVLMGPRCFQMVDPKSEQAYPVTNWVFDPVSRLVTGEGIVFGYSVRLFHEKPEAREIDITLDDISDQNKFKRWAKVNGIQWHGSEPERKAIADWLEERGGQVPDEFVTDKIGAHPAPTSYDWAGQSVVLPTGCIGTLPWRYHHNHQGLGDELDAHVLLPPRDGYWDWEWLSHFLALSSPSVTHPLLAWLVASARRIEVREFPMLFISGSSGVGKSTLADLSLRLMGSDIRTGLDAATPFVLNLYLSCTTSIPVFVDEWTRLSKKETLGRFQEVVTSIYSGGDAPRGQADLSVQHFKLTSPVIIAGENTFSLDRERDRMVTLSPSRDKQNTAALAALRGKPIEHFAVRLYEYITEATALPEFPTVANTRPEYNREILRTGWETLHAMQEWFLWKGDEAAGFVDLPTVPDFSYFDEEVEDTNAYIEAITEGLSLRDSSGLSVVWPDEEGQGTWVRPSMLIDTVPDDIRLPGDSKAMLRYLRERHPVDRRQRETPGSTKRGWAYLVHGLYVVDKPTPGEVALQGFTKQ